ncbi:MAG: AMP-binding protein, partial [bacterium]|nr:AMP-binding protein [bacterium]
MKLKDIDLVSPEEKRRLLFDFNNTAIDYPGEKTIHQLFEDQVENTPDAPAVLLMPDSPNKDLYGEPGDDSLNPPPSRTEDQIQLTYRELNQRANQSAQYLVHEKNIRPGDRVGILVSDPIHLAVYILGTLKAGAAYLPLEPSLPEERIRFMINDSCTGIVLSEKKHIRILNRLLWECPGLHSYLCIDSNCIENEAESIHSRLMDKELWHHVGEEAEDDIGGGGWTSSYTGLPLSRLEMDEYGDNIFKKLEPHLHPKLRVLEIGTASGISMFRVAPKVGFYYGTDLSEVIIEKNKERVRREGLQNISLAALPAHQIDDIKEESFDLVIINSVIQCFHGHNYLRKVIKTALELLNGNGLLFLGDIMDLDKKQSLMRDLRAFTDDPGNREKGYKTKTDISDELLISRAFWQDLALDFPEIQEITFSNKIHTIKNELTEFRYDALVTVSTPPPAGIAANHSRPDVTAGQGLYRKRKHRDDSRVFSRFGVDSPQCPVSPRDAAYVIYTSGTTGLPKGVVVEHWGVVNTLCARRDAYRLGSRHTALQLFSYVFDGFVTGFFTPLICGARLVLLPPELSGDLDTIKQAVVGCKVTHFIAVPPLYSAIIAYLEADELSSLETVTLAGDKVDPELLECTREKNANLEIVNEYGVTEASVLSTIHRNQQRDETISIGRPIANTQLYIINTNLIPQPIGVPGELCIAGAGPARGYMNNPELTAEKFITWEANQKTGPTSFKNVNETSPPSRLYKSGDLARWLADGTIQFLGRIDQQVKIRGFRIETGEIESVLKNHNAVKDAAVTARGASYGDHRLYAYYVSATPKQPGHATLKDFLARKLPEYMLPTDFIPMEKIPRTASGKVDSKALPTPGHMESKKTFTAPRNHMEKCLVAIWADVLAIPHENIGIDDDFFQLGGHSLKATTLTAKIHKEMDVKIPLAEIFKTPSIRSLSQLIGGSQQENHIAVEPVEKREYYPVTPAQQRFYLMQQMSPQAVTLNMPQEIPMGPEVDRQHLEITFQKLIKRHENLRTAFLLVDHQPVQRVYQQVDFSIRYVDLQTKSAGSDTEKSLLSLQPFDLSQAPLLRVLLIKNTAGNHRLIADMHHIISDGSSQVVLQQDFMSLYQGRDLPPMTLQYKDFSQWTHTMFSTGRMAESEDFWLKHLAGKLPTLYMPTDFSRPANKSFEGEVLNMTLGRELFGQLEKFRAETGTTLYMVLLTALNTLLFLCTGQEDITIGSPVAGRTHSDIQGIIGLVMGTLMMRSFPKSTKPFNQLLEEIKSTTLQAYEHQSYPFEELLKRVDYDDDPARNPISDIALIVQNMLPTGGGEPDNLEPPAENDADRLPTTGPAQTGTSKLDLTINAVEKNGNIELLIEYATALFRRQSMELLMGRLIRILQIAVKKPDALPADMDIVSPDEKIETIGRDVPCFPLTHPQKRILYTEQRYPDTSVNTLAFTVMYDRETNESLLEEAVNHVLQAHEGLRLQVVEFDLMNAPLQYVAPYRRYKMETIDVSGLDNNRAAGTADASLQQRLDEKTLVPFDILNSPLFYFACVKEDKNRSGYYIKLHHLISDGWTFGLVLKQIDVLYTALESGQPLPAMDSPSYVQFAAREKAYLLSPESSRDRA